MSRSSVRVQLSRVARAGQWLLNPGFGPVSENRRAGTDPLSFASGLVAEANEQLYNTAFELAFSPRDEPALSCIAESPSRSK